mgnify:CR=1 FL=1
MDVSVTGFSHSHGSLPWEGATDRFTIRRAELLLREAGERYDKALAERDDVILPLPTAKNLRRGKALLLI